ncbi:PGF-pre-PGF domain-containing protein [Methanococcoides sp. FTZ1]|uniref:PGF-pre-PGF domain-containing protein n=1 Tax=Methanococcoides sp. FTZ1 TaxID=3439061 RepID=UPI003F835E69
MQSTTICHIAIILVIATLFSALALADETLPPGSVTDLGETSVSATSITWEWTNPSDNDSSHIMIYIDGVFITNVSVPDNSYTAVGLDDSTTYQIGTRTVDTYGNINNEMVTDSATTDDATDPVISSVSLSTTTPDTGDPVVVTVDVTDNVAVSSVSASGTSLSHQSGVRWTGTITAAEGTHIVTVVATDSSGNSASDSSASYTATTPDTTDPVISSVSLSTTTPDTGDPVVVTVDVTDNVAVSSVSASGTSLSYQSGARWTGTITAAEGTHIVTVVATDSSGNSASDSSASYTATTPDTTDPVISSVSLSTTTPDTGDPVVVTVDVTDNVAVSSVSASGTSLSHQSGVRWTGTITAAEGTHIVTVVATDSSGNSASDSSASYTATTPDTTDPVISSVSLSTTTPDTGDPVVVTVDVTDNVAVSSVSASGTSLSYQSGARWTGTITAAEGTHIVTVVATDSSGNSASDSSASYTATTPDTTDPVISSVSLSTTTPDTGDPVVVTVDVTDNVAVSSVSASGTSLSYQSGARWTGTITAAEGTHIVTVVATDSSGNSASDSSASYTATTPDTTDPVISSVSLSTTTPDTGDPVVVTVDVTDNVAVSSVSASGTSLSYQSGARWTGTITAAEGTHIVTVVATDSSGNSASDSSASYTATTPDTTDPVISSVSLSTTTPDTGDPVVVTVDVTDNVAVSSVSASGTSLSHQSGVRWTGTIIAAEGTHIVTVVATDSSGNSASDSSASYTATTPDTTAPSSVINLRETSVTGTSITWEWTNPSDSDLSHIMIYIDGVFITNVNAPGNSYTATGLDDSTTYRISTRTVDTEGNINTVLISDSATTSDLTAPAGVTNLRATTVSTRSITWEWNNPSDSDLSHIMIYIDGVFITNVNAPGNSYTATGLAESTTYRISTRTVDTSGNINTVSVSDTTTTLDRSAPSSVTNLRETSVTGTSITWEWTNPSDSDLSHIEIYLDGVFITNVNAPGNSYTATGLAESATYRIGTRTVDTKSNINTNWINDSATTLDLTAPSGVTGLGESSVSSSSITWSWNNPSDSDFSHTRIYLDGVFRTSISAPYSSYTATGLDGSTTYRISTRTVDTNNNINYNWVNDSATTQSNANTDESSSSTGGGSGGGSSGTTGEVFENIDAKDVALRHVVRDIENSFTFSNEDIDITYINISTDLNMGDIKAIVESLNSRSSMISTPPEGRVYKNINIWVGDEALKNRLIVSDVGFRVDRIWLEDNDVSEYSVKLSIYRSGDWYILPTERIDEDDGYVYYETDTSGDLYSHFAIVEYIESKPVSSDTTEEAVIEVDLIPEPVKEDPALVPEKGPVIAATESELNDSGMNVMFAAIPIFLVLIVLSTSYVGLSKKQHPKTKNDGSVPEDEKQVSEMNYSEAASDSTKDQKIIGQSFKKVPSGKINRDQAGAVKGKIKAENESRINSNVINKH